MSFMSLTLNLLFFALLPPRGVRQPAFLIKVKVAFCLLSFVWFPRLPWLLDELGDSQGLWRHVWISETGTCVQRLGGVVMFGGRGFAGTILEEFREPFSFYAGTRTKRKSGVLYICVIFQTSNNKGFSNKLLLCYVWERIGADPAWIQKPVVANKWRWLELRHTKRGFPNHSLWWPKSLICR